MKKEIRLSGSGGQGLILAGIILAEGAILSDLNAVQTQSYGPEARGGASKAEVVINNNEINFPKVKRPDILLALTQKSYIEYSKDVKDDGIIILDSSIEVNRDVHTQNIISIPIIKTATEEIGKAMVANIIALGIIGELLEIVDKEKLKSAILARVPKGTEDLNMKAFEKGASLVADILASNE